MWMLESTPESPSPLLFRLLPGTIKTVGRAPRADFVVDAPLVSRLHCRLSLQTDGLLVEDLESTNGTFVNGERVTKLLMRSGDALRVGRMEFSVRRAGAGGASQPAAGG
jgi:pSer/pThr/pTyr-binding forkhead associated (FHA) protein